MKQLYKIFDSNLYKKNFLFFNVMQIIDVLGLILIVCGAFCSLPLHNILLQFDLDMLGNYTFIGPIIWLGVSLILVKIILLIILFFINKSDKLRSVLAILYSLILPFWFQTLVKKQLIVNSKTKEEQKEIFSKQLINNFFIFIFLFVVFAVLIATYTQFFRIYFYYSYYKFLWMDLICLSSISLVVLNSILLNSYIKLKKL
ncbi:hypothetical protein [Mycoplasmopsis gallinacea]|uniref:Uncharacterized protein n=1 Tax=Mycoplasmopsis gallinacea TaxID=29556 RepID=A0A449A2Y1_9BACT|nr:hypothetical protein [Mycoplasmopsis gallinacea]VEU58605.1 Uncharacterised protein [Mycoplasmopsis gallinacea]